MCEGEGDNKSASAAHLSGLGDPELVSLVDCRSVGLGHRPVFALDLLWVVGQGTAFSVQQGGV